MQNTITLDTRNTGTFLGPIASRYAYTRELRARLDDCFDAAQRSANRFFVLEGATVRAAQSTLIGAQGYMRAGFVLVQIESEAHQ